MNESIVNLDMNFSNGGGSHSATVSTIVDAKNPDGSRVLGFVDGDIGERNAFSEDQLNTLMKNFVLVEKSTSADPTKKTIQRKYSDETSMKLNSYVVLVRGINAPVPQRLPPEDQPFGEKWSKDEYAGAVPYFSEVYSDPLLTQPYGPSGPEIHKSTIIAGQVYNFEANAQFNGIKMSLVYQNNKLIPELSLNHNAVSLEYLAAPDLAQYNLKFGYTFEEFKRMLRMAEVPFDEETFNVIDGSENILFELSGSLGSVLSSIASYFGFYHYVDPFDGKVKFISSEAAALIPVEDPTQISDKTDERIISASFTESAITDNLVNSYVGTTEKSEPQSPEENEPKMRASFFKRVQIEKIGEKKTLGEVTTKSFFDKMRITQRELGAFFALFNQDEGTELFDKYTFILLMLSQRTSYDIRQEFLHAILGQPFPSVYKDNQKLPIPFGPIKLRGNIASDPAALLPWVEEPLYLPEPLDADWEVYDTAPIENGEIEIPNGMGGFENVGQLTTQGHQRVPLWGWGPPKPPKREVNDKGEAIETKDKNAYIFRGGEGKNQAGEVDINLQAAKKNDRGHKIQRTRIETVDTGKVGKDKFKKALLSKAEYFPLWYYKTREEFEWEARQTNQNLGGQLTDAEIAEIVEDAFDNRVRQSMPNPSESRLYSFLETYFKIAGGVYISNGYTKYRAERTTYENMNNITVTGPYEGDTPIRDIDDLSTLYNFLTTLGIGFIDWDEHTHETVHDLAQYTGGGLGQEFKATTTNEDESDGGKLYYFIAQKTWPKLEKNNMKKGDPQNPRVDFAHLDQQIEIFEKTTAKSGEGRYIGGHMGGNIPHGDFTWFLNMVLKSHNQYLQAASLGYPQRSLKLPYTRSRTRINKTNEAGEEAEDNALASGSEANQKLAEIYDRYDLRSWKVVAPEYSLLSKPTLTSASGTTTEMAALQAARQGDTTSTGNKLKTSSKTFYGLVLPKDEKGNVAFSAITASLSFSIGENGIQTTVGESTLKIIPPEQTFLINKGMEAAVNGILTSRMNARQKNFLGL